MEYMLCCLKLLKLFFNMKTISKKNFQVKAQKMVSRAKPQRVTNDVDELELLLFQPKIRPKSLNLLPEFSIKKHKTNISLGLPEKASKRVPRIEFGSPEQIFQSFGKDRCQKRYLCARPKSRVDGISNQSTARDVVQPDAVKNMPNTLPPIKFPKLENQPLPAYYINDLISALDDQSNNRKLEIYRDQFQELCKAVSLFENQEIQPSNRITLPKSDGFRKTIILDLDQTLIHTSNIYDAANSTKIQSKDGDMSSLKIHIRPYCKQFLAELSQIAEIVVFTAASSRYADAVLDHLDPERKFISHRLYRQHCTFSKNYFVKDLREINRSLSDMVIIDNSPYSYVLNLDNAIPIIPYFGSSKNDGELKNLLLYLREVVGVKDVRNKNRCHFKLAEYVEDYLSVTEPNY